MSWALPLQPPPMVKVNRGDRVNRRHYLPVKTSKARLAIFKAPFGTLKCLQQEFRKLDT